MATKDWPRNSLRPAIQWIVAPLAFFIATAGGVAPNACAVTLSKSDLDIWFYNMASGAGTKALGPTFAGPLTVNSVTHLFDPGTAHDTSRYGTSLVAFNTSTLNTTFPLNQYRVSSVTFKATMTYEDENPTKVLYDNQPISQSTILQEVLGENVTRQRPMELYGVGLGPGYTGYEFGTLPPIGPPLVDERTPAFSGSNGGTFVFPVVGSDASPGTYVDVSNSVTGGYSATETNHLTDPFTPIPWAIGTTNLAVGNEVEDRTTFTFEVGLNEPGVRSYIQQSLASGALGFFLSSLHSTGVQGAGGGYPKWFLKEAEGPYAAAGLLPTLTIDYQLRLPGDYDGDGVVNAADFGVWKSTFGNGAGSAADGNGDGIVNAADYTVWRDHLGGSASGSSRSS